MNKLITEPNLPRPDDFYQELTDLHRDLDEKQSQDVNARLILLLSNHIGDQAVLSEAMQASRKHIAAQ
ncbi:MAG: DUF2783 domain-containing protein [Pontibacterium sp.]